jgi:hypothetical protein
VASGVASIPKGMLKNAGSFVVGNIASKSWS